MNTSDRPLIAVPPNTGAQARSPLEATGKSIRWGVVATGKIANTVTSDLARLPDAALHGVSSRSRLRAEEFASKFGFARSYYDDDDGPAGRGYQQLFADPAVDAVYIATPHGQHHEVVRAALQAGKHVLCEKSLTINAAEAEELIELARTKKLFLMEAVWTRFLPSVQRAWEIIRSGEIGEPMWLQADLGFPSPYDPASRLWARNDGGGALLDVAVYPLTWALGVFGFPDTVQSTGVLNADGVDAQNALTLGYASGAQAQLTSSFLASSPRIATVSGTAGWIRTNAPLHNPTELTISTLADGERSETFEKVGNGYVHQLREVTRCIQQGLLESPTMPWEHSVRTMRLFDGVRTTLGIRYPNDER